MATNEIKFKSDVSVLGNFNVDSFSISRLETANLPALTTDGSVAYDTIKQSLIVYDLNNTEWKISNGSILQEDNLSIRPQGQVQFSDGNPRGSNSVDLQTVRDAVDQVAGGDYDVISGGKNNKTDSVNAWATSNTIGGGEDNTIVASYVSTIGGGQGNVLSTEAGVIGGGYYNEIYAGWQNSIFSGQGNLIGGGIGDDGGEANYIASGYNNTIGFQLGEQTISYNSICGGGSDNWIDAGTYNTLGGGLANKITKTVSTSGELPSYNTIMGGRGNEIYDSEYSVIGGGRFNEIREGNDNSIYSGGNNRLYGDFNTIVAGSSNKIYDGLQNIIYGSSNEIGVLNVSAICDNNLISGASQSTISVQQGNIRSAYNSIIGAGSVNHINKGEFNAIVAGYSNEIKISDPLDSNLKPVNNIILGARNSIITDVSNCILFGNTAEALNDGVVLFSDSSTDTFQDVAANSFNIQASGGLRLVDGNEGVGKVLTCDANGTGHWADVLGANVITSSTAPASPDEGDLWFDSSSAVLYIYYTDTGGVSQWITTSTAGYSFGSDGDGSGIVNSIIAGDGIIVDSNDPINPVISVEGVPTTATAPTLPEDGDLWFDTVEGLLYVYYNDGVTSQWVSSSTGSVGPQGEDGAVGATGPQGEDGAVGATGPNGNIDGVGDSVTGTANFTNSDNNINLTGIGNLGGLTEAGDVIQVTGSTGNNKLYTVEFRTDANNIIVNEAHAADDSWDTVPYSELDEVIESGRTYRCLIAHTGAVFATDLAAGRWLLVEYEGYKRLAAENTGTQTITLVCKAKNAPLGYGQGWVGVGVNRGNGTFGVITTNSTGRSISVAVSVSAFSVTTNNEPAYAEVYVDGRRITQAGVDDTQNALNRMTPVDFIVPPGSKYKVDASNPGGLNDLSITQWVELR